MTIHELNSNIPKNTKEQQMLDFIRDIYASFRQTSVERIKSPFLGAFVFSWIGFNWQMLAIVLFSKKEIEERLELINKSYDIGNYLVAPVFATALIVILMPQINKLITKVQSKPNAETIHLSLKSKIDIANLQQQLAESEARKKLSEKKEERFIEENIISIKQNFTKSQDSLKESEREISSLLNRINDLQGHLAKAESKFNVEQESKVKMHNELTMEKENNRILGEQIIDLTTQYNKYKSELSLTTQSYQEMSEAYIKLKRNIEITQASIRKFNMQFPLLIDVSESNSVLTLSVNKNAVESLKKINTSLIKLNNKPSQENANT